jgi:hypothetical protein
MHALVRVVARFVSAREGTPVGGSAYRARLFDQDAVADDLLDEQQPAADGTVGFTFDLAAASSLDSPGEIEPDLYVVLLRDGAEVFRSTPAADVTFLGAHPVTGMDVGKTRDLGVFRVG